MGEWAPPLPQYPVLPPLPPPGAWLFNWGQIGLIRDRLVLYLVGPDQFGLI